MSFGTDGAQGTTETTDASLAIVASYDFVDNGIPDNVGTIIQCRVIGFDSSGNTVGIEQKYVVKRLAGNCIVVASGQTIISASDLSLSTVSANLVGSGTSVQLKVSGTIATTIQWGARIDIFYYYN